MGSVLASGTTQIVPVSLAAVPSSTRQLITVEAANLETTRAVLRAWVRTGSGWKQVLAAPARVGSSGLSNAGVGRRTQGDGSTPTGLYPIRTGFGHAADPKIRMPWHVIDRDDYWSIDKRDPRTYNLLQTSRPPTARWRVSNSERLASFGAVYEFSFVIGFNEPRGRVFRRGGQTMATIPANTARGGAIFLHVGGRTPTAGCVAVRRSAMVAIARWLDPSQAPMIAIGTRKLLAQIPATPRPSAAAAPAR